ncbi:MAG TPA: DNA polymerase ligase N-terminal domain-containing protein [Isosphaeraceae bacterium]|nr:DNA polymerase ligase N-terminal domain-containing protein [Isosphaeraceae bacterium]
MPRFVLLEHTWDGVHWDFMLEDGEVLRTWAIDAPLVAGTDLPARALPDHRRLYLDYEGAVSGNRGTVRRIDAGTYSAVAWGDHLVHVRLQGSQLVGEVVLCQVGARSDGASSWVFRLGNFD